MKTASPPARSPPQTTRPQPPTPCRIRRLLKRRSTLPPIRRQPAAEPIDAITAPVPSMPKAPAVRFPGCSCADQMSVSLPKRVLRPGCASLRGNLTRAREAPSRAHNPPSSRSSDRRSARIAPEQAPRRPRLRFGRRCPGTAAAISPDPGDATASPGRGRIGSDRWRGPECRCGRPAGVDSAT